MDEEVRFVFDFWNDSEIIKHRELPKFAPTIRARLVYYTREELCNAIRNYKDILVSERHWFTYTWTLKEFLSRTNALDNFIDREAALNKYAKRKPTEFDAEENSDTADFYRDINKENFDCPKVDK